MEQSVQINGAQLLVKALREEGVRHLFGFPGGVVIPIFDALYSAPGHQGHPDPPRAGRRARRRRLRPLHRPDGGLPGHQRSRGHQHRHGAGHRQLRLGAHRLLHRAGGPAHDRQRRLPGGGHRGHHPPDHQAQLPGAGPPGPGQGHQGGLHPGLHRAARARAGGPAGGRGPGAGRVRNTRLPRASAATTRSTGATAARSARPPRP